MRPIEVLMNITSKLNLSPLSPYHALMYGRSLYFDNSKAKNEIGYNPKFSTEKMFNQSYEWYLSNKKYFIRIKNFCS